MAINVIISDDLTGASDSGVQFAQKGFRTFVAFNTLPTEALINLDSIVIDTDSRGMSPGDAYQTVHNMAKQLKKQGVTKLYKKIDSTLRGNLGAEIDAVLDVYGFTWTIVAPAFPQIGRTTIEGTHFLHGVPIHETEIGRDPKCPVRTASIADLLNSQSKRRAGVLPLPILRQGPDAVMAHLYHLRDQGVSLIVADAEENADFARLVEALREQHVLWVGSAGFAEHLSNLYGMKPCKPMSQEFKGTGPVILVSGSVSGLTRSQVRACLKDPSIDGVEFNPLSIFSPSEKEEELNRCIQRLDQILSGGRNLALFAGSSPEQLKQTKEMAKQNDWTDPMVANCISDVLGQITSQILTDHEVGGLILTGGDTAKSVCQHLGVDGLQLIGQVETGIPLSQMVGKKGYYTVTKAGAFGNEKSLLHAFYLLKGDESYE